MLSFSLSQFQKCYFFHVQVTYLKDTVSQKDMEIEQLQLLKGKTKPPSSVKDGNGNSQHTQQLSGKKTVRSLLTEFHQILAATAYRRVTGISNGDT
jgi:hypothetical protein